MAEDKNEQQATDKNDERDEPAIEAGPECPLKKRTTENKKKRARQQNGRRPWE